MKSENGGRQHDGTGTPTVHAPNDDHVTRISHLFVFHHTAEISKPSKSFISILANFRVPDTNITGPDLSGYDYGKFNSHFKDLYKLLLFPFHGFW
ncbi:MAG: hypothetical protein ACHQHN_00845 [Sphingobacteriales bacterium]